MTQVQIRPYQPSDAEAVATVLNAIDRAVGRPAVLTASLIDEFVSGTVASTATDSQVVSTDAGIVAAGFVTTPPPGGYRLAMVGGVAPEARGQGIGRALLGWQLDRAEEIHAAIAPGATWEVHADVVQLDTSAVATLAHFGLRPVRYAFDMLASTAAAPDAPSPDGVTISAYRAGQDAAVHAAHMEAFADHWGFQYRPYDAWSSMTVNSMNFNPGLSVVAMADSEIAGYVLAYDDAIAEQVYLGQVGVRRPWRRQGLAGAMLACVLRLGADAGRTQAALDVDADSLTGAVGVYERVGFHTEHTLVTYARSLT